MLYIYNIKVSKKIKKFILDDTRDLATELWLVIIFRSDSILE